MMTRWCFCGVFVLLCDLHKCIEQHRQQMQVNTGCNSFLAYSPRVLATQTKHQQSFVPVLESSDNFLNENDLISDGLVSLDFQQHVMVVLTKVEKYLKDTITNYKLKHAPVMFHWSPDHLIRLILICICADPAGVVTSCQRVSTLPSLPSCWVGFPVLENWKVW